MRRFINSTFRQAHSELRYLHYSRIALGLLGVLAAGVILSFVSSLSSARSAHHQFVQEVAEYQARGITLAEALAAPLVVTRNNGEETIDNPLKYDYLEVGKSVAAVKNPAMISTALDFTTFLVVPLVLFALGAYVVNLDRRSGTSGLRAARERWSYVTAGKLLTMIAVSLAVPLVIAGLGLVTGLVGSGLVAQLEGEIDYTLVTVGTAPVSGPQLALTGGIALFFAVLGYAVGYLTRSFSWPVVLVAAALFALPFVNPWDPRNLLAVVGSHVYTFWGQFKLRPPLDLSVTSAALGLSGYLVAALVVVLVSARSPRLH